MPCSDSDTCDNKSKTEQTSHNHSEDEGDLCSPFCLCACCGCMGFSFHIYIPKLASFNIAQAIIIFPEYKAFFPSQHFSIWQPPKLV
jgi:hypothetical protein